VLPVVLVKNENALSAEALLDRARNHGVLPELGAVLDLTSELSGRPLFAQIAAGCPPNAGPPRYLPEENRGPYGRRLADLRTPPVVARRGFRMNATEDDMRGFLRKHLGG
jgi:hypothetical protein